MYLVSGVTASREALQWDRLYSRRRERHIYSVEEGRFLPDSSEREHVVSTFLSHRRSGLSPPEDLCYVKLRAFLLSGNTERMHPRRLPTSTAPDLVLIDDRQDTTGGATSTRLWDSDGDPGYMRYPPEGDRICTRAMDIPELICHLRKKVRTSEPFDKLILIT